MRVTKATKTALAKKLGIGRSTLCYKSKKPPSDEALRVKIAAVMAGHPAYGPRRVMLHLGMNRKPLAGVMRLFGLLPRARRGVRLTKPGDLGRPDTRIPNILKVPCPIRPNIVWAGDFACLWRADRFWRVATVIDIRTREVLGRHAANYRATALVMEAFKDAMRRTGAAPAWFRSDQGSEHAAGGVRAAA